MVLGPTQPLTEMCTRHIPGGKGRPAPKADNLTAICDPIVYRQCGNLDVSQPCGSPRPVTWNNFTFQFGQTQERDASLKTKRSVVKIPQQMNN
jgi:hypothetical protein